MTSKNLWTKNIRVGFIDIMNIKKSAHNLTVANVSNSLDGQIVNATIVNVKSLYKRKDVSDFFKIGTTLSAFMVKKSNEKLRQADEILFHPKSESSKLISALSFCPIDKNNVITLVVRINSVKTPYGGAAQATAVRHLEGAELAVVIGKHDDKSRYDWMVIVRN
jgi:hypothetical protein